MQKALLIAEKPSLMRDIKNAYMACRASIPYDIDFTAQHGHLVELKNPIEIDPKYKSWDVNLLPINPKYEGGWEYKIKSDSRDTFNEIKKAIHSGTYDVIIHAGDPDQEGELLVRLVLQKAGNKLPVLRFWSNDTTQAGLEKGLQNLKPDSDPMYENLYKAALIRSQADWLMGMNGSRAIADRIFAGRDNKIAAGRVMTAIQTMIVDREDEINNFIPKTVYGVKVKYDNTLEGTYFIEQPKEEDEAKKADKEDEEGAGVVWFDTKAEAEDFIRKLGNTGVVVSIEKKQIKTSPPKLYKLATIQMDAAKLGFSASDTLATIQSLYEKHFVSYPRTDCEVLSSQENFKGIISSAACIPELASYASDAVSKIGKIVGQKKYVNDAELAKHGHSALVPTATSPDFTKMNKQEEEIYKLIAKRFMCIFQDMLIQEKTIVITDIDGNKFRSTGKRIIQRGYIDFTGEKITDVDIPLVNKGDKLNKDSADVVEKTSVCPKRFTSGTLIAAMENPAKYLTDKTIKDIVKDLHIGTPATRANIIDKLIDDKYIELKGNYYYPTVFGSFMIHTIRGICLCRVDTTGQWEEMLEKVRDGSYSVDEAECYMEREVNVLLKDVSSINKASFGNNPEKTVLMACPNCGKDILEGPRNYYCSGWKEGCKYSIIKKNEKLGVTYSTKDAIALFSGKVIEKKMTKNGKSWNQKLYFNPDAEWNPTFVEATAEETGYICPECGQTLIQKGKRVECSGCHFGTYIPDFGRELKPGELDYIFKHGNSNGKLEGFVSKKTGKTYSAKIILELNGKDSKMSLSFD